MSLLRSIAEPYAEGSFSGRFRRARYGFFLDLLAASRDDPDKTWRILDVGGVEDFWEQAGFPPNCHFTILNLDAPAPRSSNVVTIEGDARDLSRFEDQSFDLVFSNSVIEHVGTLGDQRRMADEVRRVGRDYFVQTPSFWFPVEPHAVFPMFHWLPVPVRAWLLNHLSLGHLGRRRDPEDALAVVRSIRIMRESELRRAFPDGAMWQEKLFGRTKSLTVYRMPARRDAPASLEVRTLASTAT
ncbi:MAG TPA: class I SAM-dependent methyltransferase [Dehalococcoidia bacterium]|nr:class I SAM-dependent methyltransferase [Dehalococcoidia bacterium]